MPKELMNNMREILLGDTKYSRNQNIPFSFMFDFDNLNLTIVKIVLSQGE